MTPNKEFISLVKEKTPKMDAARVPQLNPAAGSFMRHLRTKEDAVVPLSFASVILNSRVSDGSDSMTVNNNTADTGEKSIILTAENTVTLHKKSRFSVMQKPDLNTEVSK